MCFKLKNVMFLFKKLPDEDSNQQNETLLITITYFIYLLTYISSTFFRVWPPYFEKISMPLIWVDQNRVWAEIIKIRNYLVSTYLRFCKYIYKWKWS